MRAATGAWRLMSSFAEQNERLVKNAEEYYRSMFRKRESSWNLRDRHMADTLEHLAGFLTGQGQHAKIIVWEHNSHLGDARATEMRGSGEKLTLLERYRRHISPSLRIDEITSPKRTTGDDPLSHGTSGPPATKRNVVIRSPYCRISFINISAMR